MVDKIKFECYAYSNKKWRYQIMRRHCCFTLILFSLILLANSANAITVEEIYTKFSALYNRSKNFSADFEEITHVQNNRRTAKGKIIFAKPNLLRKEYIDQSNPKQLLSLLILDGKMSWNYVPMLNQVTTSKMEGKELLPGIGQPLKKFRENFDLKLIKDEAAEKKGIYHVGLSIKQKKMEVKSNAVQQSNTTPIEIEIWLRAKDYVPIQFSYRDKANDMLYITSFKPDKNINLDQKLEISTFKMDIPDGVEVIDISP